MATRTGMRIGELAERCGVTPRTVRHYEELGLLPEARGHEKGRHRLYTDADVERLNELLRLRDLLGLSLTELRALAEAEEARSALRREWHEGAPDDDERRAILDQAIIHLERQIALVGERRKTLGELQRELREKLARAHDLRAELD